MKRAFTIMLMTVVLLLSFSSLAAAESVGSMEAPYRQSVVLWNADESWGDEFELDTKNQLEGQGCASLDLHASEGVHRAQRSIAPADATGMDTLEFDLYLSNITHVRDFRAPNRQGALVIASEKGALYFDMRMLLYMIEDHDLVRGWNHIVIPLDPLAIYLGEFDASRINQISIYWESTAWFEERSIIKFDRFMLTDRDAVAKEDPTVKQTLGAYVDLLARIKENYVACIMLPRIGVFESDVDAAPLLEQCMTNINSYSEIPEKDKALLDAKGYGRILSESRFRAKEYQDAKETLTQVSAVVSQIISLAEYIDRSALTLSNFQDIYDKTVQVRADYENLLRSQKEVIGEQGYLDILVAVENTVLTHTHYFVLEVVSDAHLAHTATCTESARYYYQCDLCDAIGDQTYEYGEPLGHDLTEGYISCDVQGHSMHCHRCKEYVNMIPHNFDEWVTVREATEAESGLQKRACMMCSYEETQELAYVRTDDDGCSAVLVSGAPAMLALIAAAGWMLRKKKK